MTNEVDEMSDASRGSVANYPAFPNSWIPVTERLPAMGQQVLVVALGRVITATRRDGWWRHEIDTGTQTFSLGVCTPTYLMPLPAPPTDGKQSTERLH
jgi:hypothetical protein